MTENKRESGARIAKEDHRPLEVDQRAAENKRPRDGAGLSQPHDESHEETRQSDQAGTTKSSPEGDARGAYAKTQHGGDNDGVLSAEPRVIAGNKSGDATFKHTFKGADKE